MTLPAMRQGRCTVAADGPHVAVPEPRPCPPATAQRRRSFPGAAAELKHLRHWLAGLLPDIPARDDVVTIAVELATNAVRHSATGRGGFFAAEISWRRHPGVLRLAVTDGGAPQGPRWPTGACPLGEGGRGLYLVSALASRTGDYGDHRSRQVWAELPWPAEASPRIGP